MIHSKHYPFKKSSVSKKLAEDQESTKTILVIHGLFGNSDNWHSIAQALSSEFNIYTIDLPNHGQSSPLEQASYDTIATLINEWMQQIKLEKCFLLGHSMGGKVAMQLATQYPEKVQGLIVVDIAPVDYPSGHHDIFDGLKAINPQVIHSRKQADTILRDYEPLVPIRQFLLKSLIKGDNGFQWLIHIDNLFNNYVSIRSAPPLPASYQGNTLFIKGENSTYIQEKHRDTILHWFPTAQVKIIPDAGHWLHAEKPLPFTSLVKRFCHPH